MIKKSGKIKSEKALRYWLDKGRVVKLVPKHSNVLLYYKLLKNRLYVLNSTHGVWEISWNHDLPSLYEPWKNHTSFYRSSNREANTL